MRLIPDAIRRSPPARVWALTGVLGVTGAVLFATGVRPLEALDAPVTVPLLALVVLFAVAEAGPIHLQFRRNAYTHTLTEVPLLLGLVFAEPAAVVGAYVLGSGLALSVHRRQPVMKLGFNLAKILADASIVVIVYHALLGGALPVSGRSWLAGGAAMLVSWAFTSVAIAGVIALREGRDELDLLRLLPLTSLIAVAANTSLGLLAVTVAWHQPTGLWLVGAVTLLLFSAYRSYNSWRQRHDALRRLHDLTHDGAPLPVPQAVRRLLLQAADLLRAERAEVVLVSEDDPETAVRSVLDASGTVTEEHGAVSTLLPHGAHPVRVRRRTKDKALRAWAEAKGFEDAIAVPLRGKAGVLGRILVADRLGDVDTFDENDVRLLETFANHASVALENSRLVERLRAEVTVREHEALHDSLTGLPNRMLFHERVAEAIRNRSVGEHLAVLLIDLDHFKEVNDTLGHHIGDQLLARLARELEDNIGAGEFVARLGGDEFAVLLTHLDDRTSAVEVAERLRRALASPHEIDDLRLELGGSIGIAVCPADGEDSSTLLKRADVAMYLAKERHSGVELYRPDRDYHSPRRLALAGRLREAIEQSHLTVHYQPKAELETGTVIGVEALARWHHPEHGFISPDEFIPMAEQAGLIRPLTRFVLRTVLGQWGRWAAGGEELEIAVNLSPWNLLDSQLGADLRALLGEYEVPPSGLRLEITESGMMTDPHRTGRVIDAVHGLGVGLSIDDFGTGYSSLTWLKRLPVDEVKIDRSFVANMGEDESDEAIVRSTIDLGRHLGLTVVAEGVEDRATWDRLRALHCHAAQGYLLSRPVTAENLSRWLRAYRKREPFRARLPGDPSQVTID